MKMTPTVLKTMFDEVVKIVNLIKSRLFNSTILRACHDKIDGSLSVLLLSIELIGYHESFGSCSCTALRSSVI